MERKRKKEGWKWEKRWNEGLEDSEVYLSLTSLLLRREPAGAGGPPSQEAARYPPSFAE